jgi:hypothetical protein
MNNEENRKCRGKLIMSGEVFEFDKILDVILTNTRQKDVFLKKKSHCI